jgi:hypothetical protein
MAGLIGKQNLRALSFEPLERDFQYLMVSFLFLAGIVVGNYLFDLMFVAPVAVVEGEDDIIVEIQIAVPYTSAIFFTLTAYLYGCNGSSNFFIKPGFVGDFVTNLDLFHIVKKL